MSTAARPEPRIKHLDVTDDAITAQLIDGRVISVPVVWSWRLADATPAQRANWQLTGDGHGVYWPDVDEDLSAEGMLTGVPAPRRPNDGLPTRLLGDKAPSSVVREKRATYRKSAKRRPAERQR